MTSPFTSIEDFTCSHDTLHNTFSTGRTKSLAWRKWQLKQSWWLIEENEQLIIDALYKDLHRHPFETFSMELRGMKADILEHLEKFETWAKDDVPDAGFFMGTLGRARLRKEPLGVALVIAAWNFPMLLCVMPMVAAIAAGNCVMLKPSELAHNIEQLLVELIPKYMDQDAVRVVTGGPEQTAMILEKKFNHIFYTGSNAVGKIVAKAASRYLTPVVLELGGQAPAIVGKTADIDLAAKRMAYAKLLNVGQICLNVNHIFADPSIHDRLIQRLIYWYEEMQKEGDEDFSRIINERHFDRITALLNKTDGKVAYGGETDREKKYIKPTIVRDVTMKDSLLSEELFAPIAPIINAEIKEAIATINLMPHPLGLYIFSKDQKEIDHIIDSTTSGGVTINDIMIHAGVPNAPFGGVGESGYGSYHGRFGFDAFSHTRTIVAPPTWLEKVMTFRYAPYNMDNRKYFDVKNKMGFKKGETMEDQKIGEMNLMKVCRKALLAITVLAVADSASGGRLLFVHTLRDFANRLKWKG